MIKDVFKKWIKDQIDYQRADFTNTEPVYRLSRRDGRFYFNSCAGVLSYKPKNDQDASRFRDKWINRFEYIKGLPLREQRKQFFVFYDDIRRQEKIKYRANLKTRVRGKVCNFIALS